MPALNAALPRPLPVIADARHSLGGSLGGRPVGSIADITTLSFHPVKQMTTGEGGVCLTDDDGIARRIRSLRNHGMTSTADERTGALWKYDVTMLGDNHRMTSFQAALGASQLRRLDDVVAERSEIADRYDALLSDIPGSACRRDPTDGGARGICTRSRSIRPCSAASATPSSTRSAPRASRRRCITRRCTCSRCTGIEVGCPGRLRVPSGCASDS